MAEDPLMRIAVIVAGVSFPLTLSAQAPAPFRNAPRTIDSIPAPESVTVGPDGAWYVSSFGKFDTKGDGAVYRVDPDKGTPARFVTGLDDPCGVVFLGDTLWVA